MPKQNSNLDSQIAPMPGVWMGIPATGPLLRPADAARYLGLGISTMYDQIQRGEIPPLVKIGARASGIPKPWLDAAIQLRAANHGHRTPSAKRLRTAPAAGAKP